MKNKNLGIFGCVLFIFGILCLVFVATVSIWGDIEALFFNAGLRSEGLNTLKCPPVITKDETGTVTASFHNPDDELHTLDIRMYITQGYVTLMTEYLDKVQLQPDETKALTWEVNADNAAYDRLILLRVHQMKRYPMPYMNASCGIVVLNIPFMTGNQFVIILLGLGVLLTAGGILSWHYSRKSIKAKNPRIIRRMVILSAISVLFVIVSLAGMWILSIGFGLFWLLLAFVMLRQFFSEVLENAQEQP